jgi:serine/threonine protein kinase
VYRAVHIGLHKPVVIKVLHPHYAQSAEIRERFAREGRASAAIRHPHIVDVTDIGDHEETPFLIMELLEGESFATVIERSGALTPEGDADLMIPVIAAVDAAHSVAVIHRDQKPDNLFVTKTETGDPFPKVLDFGISKVHSGLEGFRMGKCAFDADNVYKILKLVGDGIYVPPLEANRQPQGNWVRTETTTAHDEQIRRRQQTGIARSNIVVMSVSQILFGIVRCDTSTSERSWIAS